ncbi:hypothetical protein MXD81_29315 [Microbacteriaceae bacterium K1510]|nr:hypothetical protein [Microbacteriaceae bacterium K1510]
MKSYSVKLATAQRRRNILPPFAADLIMLAKAQPRPHGDDVGAASLIRRDDRDRVGGKLCACGRHTTERKVEKDTETRWHHGSLNEII